MRSGQAYMQALKDGRSIYLDGERIADVTVHPAFAPAVRLIADTYEHARDAANLEVTSYIEPDTGQRRHTMWLVPRSAQDLTARRQMHEFWAKPSYGHMGRTPDHVASTMAAFVASPEVFARGGAAFAQNVQRFYAKACEDDLYIAYVIVPPQGDRTKPAHQQPDPHLYAGMVKERDDGIVLRGAQMIGTSAPLADSLFFTSIVPLQPGDEDYALSVVLPCNTPGLKMYPRRPYAPMATSVYDYPLSSRFDETDSLIVFDDVFIPWEQVFVYRDVPLTQAQFHETGAHLLANFQALVRFSVKLKFLTGLARKLCELHNIDTLPPVQATVGGELAATAALFESLMLAAETRPLERHGMAVPHPQFVYTGMALQRKMIVDVMRSLRELCGGGPICVPSSVASFTSEVTASDTARYYRSANTPAEERVKILKLVWDAMGSEFAGRQLQYEMFYSAAQHIADQRVFRTYEWHESTALAEQCLASYGLDGAFGP